MFQRFFLCEHYTTLLTIDTPDNTLRQFKPCASRNREIEPSSYVLWRRGPPSPRVLWRRGAVRNTRAPTSPRSNGFCAIWDCISSSSSWLRSMRHKSFGGNRRASAAALMSFRLPSIPCMHRTPVRSCPFTEFAGECNESGSESGSDSDADDESGSD